MDLNNLTEEITLKENDNNSPQNKRLIILDVNGLLCRKILKSDQCNSQSKNISPKRLLNTYEVIDLNKYIVVIRPGVRKLLDECYSYGKVAFWSSTNQVNAEPILKHILTEEQYENALFKWYRSKTRPDPDTSKFATVKVLDDLFETKEYTEYGFHNTVICDDEEKKLRFSPRSNSLVFPSFDTVYSNQDDGDENIDSNNKNKNTKNDLSWVNDLYEQITHKFEQLEKKK